MKSSPWRALHWTILVFSLLVRAQQPSQAETSRKEPTFAGLKASKARTADRSEARREELNLESQLAWQLALEREGFSPGILDGKMGPKARTAIQEFQKFAGLRPSGDPDSATAAVLGVAPEMAVRVYTVSQADADRIAPLPKTWPDKAKVRWLGYETVLDAVAERFHCTHGLLAKLNPGVDFSTLKPGDSLRVPNVAPPKESPLAHFVVVDLSAKQIRAVDRSGAVFALFHCSVAELESNLPTRDTTVQVISHEPSYLFDPKMWPEVTGVDRKLLIPPGPRNPVGLVWIGLGLPGYGIHGTPKPELIGKTGSHGCIRLTNWDALRLSKMVRAGTSVRFVRRTRDTTHLVCGWRDAKSVHGK